MHQSKIFILFLNFCNTWCIAKPIICQLKFHTLNPLSNNSSMIWLFVTININIYFGFESVCMYSFQQRVTWGTDPLVGHCHGPRQCTTWLRTSWRSGTVPSPTASHCDAFWNTAYTLTSGPSMQVVTALLIHCLFLCLHLHALTGCLWQSCILNASMCSDKPVKNWLN